MTPSLRLTVSSPEIHSRAVGGHGKGDRPQARARLTQEQGTEPAEPELGRAKGERDALDRGAGRGAAGVANAPDLEARHFFGKGLTRAELQPEKGPDDGHVHKGNEHVKLSRRLHFESSWSARPAF